jgi:hypothetical protein
MAETLDGTTYATEETPGRWRLTALVDGLWRGLVDLRLLLAVLAVMLLLALIALGLPQLPDQVRTDPGEANRWLLATAERTGGLGEILGASGLFSLLRSPIFQLALAGATVLLLIQLAYVFGAALQLRHVAQDAEHQPSQAGEAVALPPGRRIYRLRRSVEIDDAADKAEDSVLPGPELAEAYPTVARSAITVAAAEAPGLSSPENPVEEYRTLALRSPWAAWLKLCLPMGLLLFASAIWLLARYGWEVTIPTLAPGETFRYAAGSLELRYDVPVNEATGGATPTLIIDAGEAQERLPLTAGAWANVGGAIAAAEPATTAMLVRTRGSQPLLAQPGQSTPSTAIGLLFPSAGSEQALLLPRQGAGLRIVRAGDGRNEFMVEFYPRNSTAPDPILRVRDDEPQFLTFEDGQIVDLLPVPSVRVTVRRMPGLWLLLPALLLTIVGLIGYWRRPGFALLQDAPWSPGKRVVIVQSDRRATIAAVDGVLADAGEATE